MKYRVYAKVLSYLLPDESKKIKDTYIKKLSQKEQKKRGFKPLEGYPPTVSEDHHKTYLTYPEQADLRIMKSDHVIYTDINADDSNRAVARAKRKFDNVIGALKLATAKWYSKNYDTSIHNKSGDYQIAKIYKLEDGIEIGEVDVESVPGTVSMINYPAESSFSKLDVDFIDNILNSKDNRLQKALYYFVKAEQALHSRDAFLKVFLSCFKSIELIAGAEDFRLKTIKSSLKRMCKKLDIEDKKDDILKLYDTRSNGDFAHARSRNRTSRLPDQLPEAMPHDTVPADFLSLASEVIINYFLYIDGLFEVKLDAPSRYFDEDGQLMRIRSVLGGKAHFIYRPTDEEKGNRRKITPSVKKKMAEKFDVPIKYIKSKGYEGNSVYIKHQKEYKWEST